MRSAATVNQCSLTTFSYINLCQLRTEPATQAVEGFKYWALKCEVYKDGEGLKEQQSVITNLCEWSFPTSTICSSGTYLQTLAVLAGIWELKMDLTHCNSNTYHNYTCESIQTPDPTNASKKWGRNPESCFWMMLTNWMPHKLIKRFSHMHNIQPSRFWLAEHTRKNRTVAICNCFKGGKFPYKTRSVVNARMK